MSGEPFKEALLSFLEEVRTLRRDRGVFDSYSIDTVISEIQEFVSNYKGAADGYKAIIFDTKHKAYWRHDSKGYTINTEEAGLYTLEDIANMNVTASCRYHVPFPPNTPLSLANDRRLDNV